MLNRHLIKNLQNKPENFKRVVMWIGVASTMTAIFAFWLLTFPSQIPPKSEENEAAANLKKELPGIWQTFKNQLDNLQDVWQNKK